MNNLSINNDPIDAVITWVDGNDPQHIAKRNLYLNEIDQETTGCATLEGRFLQINEIKYCIFSIRKFAPLIRNIFLVTDEQCPNWLTEKLRENLRVTIIDHKVIFRDHLQYLPTFNTRSINTLLWKIPDLSENFLVFNDDCFLVNQTSPVDFYVGENLILRGHWRLSHLTLPRIIKRSVKNVLIGRVFKENFRKIQNHYTMGAKLAGYDKEYFESVHAPFPMKKSVIENFFRENQELLENNIRYRFRNKNQFTASGLFFHLILKEGKAIVKDGNDSIMIIPRIGGLKQDRYKFDLVNQKSNDIKFLCFQDLFYLKQENPHEFAEVIDYLEKTIMSNQSRKI